jgi:hypothetical protein
MKKSSEVYFTYIQASNDVVSTTTEKQKKEINAIRLNLLADLNDR